MPRSELEDSDDDGAGVFLEPEIPATKSQLSARQDEPTKTNTTTAVKQQSCPNLDGTNDQQSTTSTERLNKDIRSAERHLVHDSGDTRSSDSPAGKTSKRRHTEAHGYGFEGSVSPEKSVKRTKTLKTYGSNNRPALALPDDDGHFCRLRDDGPRTSQSAPSPNGALMNGSIGRDFMEHQPIQMFNDSGTTAEYGTASQRRMEEVACASRVDVVVPGLNLPLTESDKSSSFPWTASEQTPKVPEALVDGGREARGVTGVADAADAADSAVDAGSKNDADGSHEGDNDRSHAGTHQSDQSLGDPNVTDNVKVTGSSELSPVKTLNHAPPAQDEMLRRRSSPRVEIPVQKAGRGRKKRIQDDLDSDEIAIGLPKEHYVPRPSRRRTQAVDEPIDFSVIPEKAAKIKRNKTAVDSAIIRPSPQVQEDHSMAPEDVALAPKTGQAWNMINTWLKSPEEPMAAKKQDQLLDARSENDNYNFSPKFEPAISPPAADTAVSVSTTAGPLSTTQTASPLKDPDDAIFVKPAPKQKSSASKAKAKRRATTIFEDHVDFHGSQRTPTLSQRQAARQIKLADESDEDIVKPVQSKRRKVIDDDDDDQDELALDSSEQQRAATAGPSKRGRGRPRKSPAAAAAVRESTERSCVDKEEDEGFRRPRQEIAGIESPVGLQRLLREPAKRAAALDQEQTRSKQPSDGEAGTAMPSKSASPALQALTPSSEHAASDPARPSTPTVSATTKCTHSPIKSTSKVTYRVGLSKKHRIPSLLRTMRPLKR